MATVGPGWNTRGELATQDLLENEKENPMATPSKQQAVAVGKTPTSVSTPTSKFVA
jgi:hypothetical protein